MIGTIINWATAARPDKSAYLIPLGLIYVVSLTLAIALIFLPESPRWLIERGHFDAGCKSLHWLRPADSDADSEANEIRAAIQVERETKGSIAIKDVFIDPVDRRRTLVSICSVSLQGVPGSMFVIGTYPSISLLLSPSSRNIRTKNIQS